MSLPKNVRVFDIRKQEVTDRDSGKKVVKPKVVFNKDIEIRYKGELLDLGQYKGGFLKTAAEITEGLNSAAEAGKLDAEYVEQQVTFLQEKNVSSAYEWYAGKK